MSALKTTNKTIPARLMRHRPTIFQILIYLNVLMFGQFPVRAQTGSLNAASDSSSSPKVAAGTTDTPKANNVPGSNCIYIDAKVNGQAVHLLFDTGAGNSVLFRKTAIRLGLTLADPPPGYKPPPGQLVFSYSDKVLFSVLGRNYKMPLVVVDFPVIYEDGMLSWTLYLDDFLVVDFDHLKVSYTMPRPTDLGSWMHWTIPQDVEKIDVRVTSPEGKVDIVSAYVYASLAFDITGPDGQIGQIFLDTGDPYGVQLAPGAWLMWRAQHPDAAKTLVIDSMPVEAHYAQEC